MKADESEWNAREFAAATAAFFSSMLTLMVAPPLLAGRLTLSGSLYGVGLLVGTLGLIGFAARRKRAHYLVAAGILLGLVAGTTRLATTGVGGAFTGGEHRGSIVSEQDFMVVGATWLPFTGLFESHENDGFAASITALSRTIRSEDGASLGRAQPGETYVYEAAGEHQGTFIFLHGYAGNVPSFCWVVASAAAAEGWTTLCPSCGFRGAWWEPECSSRVHEMVAHARTEGRVVLGGLSNGAMGTARLVESGLHDLNGAVLISGGSPGAEPGPFPVLLIYGEADARFPSQLLERYAAAAADATVVPRPFGHFLLTKDYDRVRAEVRAWLRSLPE